MAEQVIFAFEVVAGFGDAPNCTQVGFYGGL